MYSQAGDLMEDFVRWSNRVNGPNHPLTAVSMYKLASIYNSQQHHARAASLLEQSLEIRENDVNTQRLEIAGILDELAFAYLGMDLYAKAESRQLRALQIKESALGPNDVNTTVSVLRLAAIHSKQGRYGRAQELFYRALAIFEREMGLEKAPANLILVLLASNYFAKGEYDKAESFYQRALAAVQRETKPEDRNVIDILYGLASTYLRQSKYDLAEAMYLRVLSIQERLLGPDHPSFVRTLNSLGTLHILKGNYDNAESLLLRALSARNVVVDSRPIESAVMIENLAGLYGLQGRYAESVDSINRAESIRSRWLRGEVPLLSPSARTALHAISKGASEFSYSMLGMDPSSLPLALSIRLDRQGLLQEIEKRQRVLGQADRNTRAVAEELSQNLQRLSSVSIPPSERAKLREDSDRMAAGLYLQLPALQLPRFDAVQIAAALKPGEALVEFQKFRRFNPRKPSTDPWGDAEYVVLILLPSGEAKYVPLGKATPIDQRIAKALSASAENQADAAALWASVSALVIEPIHPYLAGTREWFLSPDGDLHRVPFAALSALANSAQTHKPDLQLRVITTGRDLVALQTPAPKGNPAVVMVDPAYDRRGGAPSPSPATTLAQARSSDLSTIAWAPLPSTSQEGKQVAALLGTKPISGVMATATTLQQVRSPRVLHVATHGYFLADLESKPKQLEMAAFQDRGLLAGFQGEDPMLRSGLVMAGANQPDIDPTDDGYLTALEVTGMHLDGTELVVLSACNTLKGDLHTGEGVYGLQRALTVAGARSTLLSLWPVDDAATAEFMRLYYSRLKAGEGRSEALEAVQREFRTNITYKAKGWDQPYYWAAWQLTGDWRPITGL
jgi:CHAT domain-containing protein/tetratricopeptide (TPR) repeat protein